MDKNTKRRVAMNYNLLKRGMFLLADFSKNMSPKTLKTSVS